MKRARDSGFALVLILVAIVMLTITVVAFLGSVTIERRTAKAYQNIAKADEVARAGLDAAIARLEEAVERARLAEDDKILSYRDYIVFERSSADPSLSPILAMGRNSGTYGEPLALAGVTPLISTNTSQTAPPAFDGSYSAAFKSLEGARQIQETTLNLNSPGHLFLKPGSPGETSRFRAPAVEIKDADGKVVGRYAFLFLDEQARLNPFHHRVAKRNEEDDWGKTAEPIPFDIGSLDDTSLLLTAEEQTKLLTFPSLLICSPRASAHVFANRDRFDEVQNYLTGGETHDEDVIPAGLSEAGRPKYNLNDLATKPEFGAAGTQRSTYIAEAIDRNLPGFKLRDPALQSDSSTLQKRYLKRLAASIVDYIDEDSGITLTEDGEPAGRDLFPLVVTTAERFRQLAASGNSRPIESQGFVQFWNPYTKPVSGRVRLRFYNRRVVRFGEAIEAAFEDYFPPPVTISLQPNEMKTYSFEPTTQTFTSPGLIDSEEHPQWDGGVLGAADETTHQPFEVYWCPSDSGEDFRLADMTRRAPVAPDPAVAGLYRGPKTLSDTKPHSQYNFIHIEKGAGDIYRFGGDPRGTYLSAYDWNYATNFIHPRWQGRQEDVNGRTQEYATAWSNREPTRANPNRGTPLASGEDSPAEVPSAYVPSQDGQNAPFYIKNGPMVSIGELGHIFDPAQADDAGNASMGGSPSSRFVSSGGRSLRIGYPEFDYWSQKDDTKRAIHLLDIFSVNPVEQGFPRSRGTININTAPEPVLQALFAGIELNSDKGLSPAPAITPEGTQAMARAIIENRPFARLSDLSQIFPTITDEPTFFDPPLPTPAGSMDRIREELFSKAIQSVSLRSHRFRVVVLGQNYNEKSKIAGQSILEAVVTLDAAGAEPDEPLKATIRYLRHAN